MKSIRELAIDHCESWIDELAGNPDEYSFTLDQLESLINEVILQRLGEPVAYISLSSLNWALSGIANGIGQFSYIEDKSDGGCNRPLYALNIES